MKKKSILVCLSGILTLCSCGGQSGTEARMISPNEIECTSQNYLNNRAPLVQQPFMKLPPSAITPRGWIGKQVALMKDGLAGNLGEISAWLDKNDNAWLVNGGSHGWEEVPYWLRGYSNMAYILSDSKMLDETKIWIEAILSSAQEDGYFGPINAEADGRRELWANMLALQILQDYYMYSGDERVISVMKGYFRWQLAYPDDRLLRSYWENSRGGDNLLSVIWLYNQTGDEFLLDLMHKIHRCTANWHQDTNLPNWHNVNVAECFREPAEYFLVSKDSAMLKATYNNFNLIRRIYGQVPGGMFGSDENCRLGYVDPRQATETCGFVEQMLSDEILMAQTGDIKWMENLEDVAFNSLPAAMTDNMRALRYLTSPNMVLADSKNHAPSVQNGGPFLCMNPFSSRCCQHNHAMGWPYYAQNLVLASADGGAALLIYGDCKTTLLVGDRKEVTLNEETHYPFDEHISVTVNDLQEETAFPLYLRIPTWAKDASVKVNGKKVGCKVESGLLCINRTWTNKDKVELCFPMQLSMRQWSLNKNSQSINYGPLSLSLEIQERYELVDSKANAIGDSHWQENADASKWPTYEIYPETPWNYALDGNLNGMQVIKGEWPEDDMPFNLKNVPLHIKAQGARIPSWGLDQTGTCQVLPESDEPRAETEEITLVPMGAARLRIASFPPLK